MNSILLILPMLALNMAVSSPATTTTTASPGVSSPFMNELPANFQIQIDRLSMQLEKFNDFYLTMLDQKMTAMQNSLSALDGNVQSLHEKAHTWSIFRHNIDAWSDHMKSLDQKVDLIKRTQDEYQSIESKLNSLEYAINHILAKVNKPDEKTNEIDEKVIEKINEIHKIVKTCDVKDASDKQDIHTKLNNILKHLVGIRQNNLNRSNRNTSNNPRKIIYTPQSDNVVEFLRDIESKVDGLIEKVSSKEFISADNTNTESIEDVLDVLRRIDDRTIQNYNEGNNQNTKLMSCCRSTSNELATFTDSADILLKRIERLLMIVQSKVEKRTTVPRAYDEDNGHFEDGENDQRGTTTAATNRAETTKRTETIHLDDDEYRDDTEEVDSPTERTRRNDTPMERVTSEDDDYYEHAEFNQTARAGCAELDKHVDGVYFFGTVPDTNVIGRSFNERLCNFPTDGQGWTVIQNRGPYEIQENFNRSWYDYKHGFGDLQKDFWFGNDYIHRLVADNPHELRIELEDFDGVQVWAEYSVFGVGSEENNYRLNLSGFRGAVADSMLYHHDNEFSTYDRKNDKSVDTCCPCAPGYGSGWWFDNCSEANLNGIYRKAPNGHNFIGIIWEHWHGDYSLKKAKMMIRPKRSFPSYGAHEPIERFADIPEDP